MTTIKHNNYWLLTRLSFVAALGGLLFGFDTAVINGALPYFTQYFALSNAMRGFVVSSALIGCVLGALLIGRPADIYGRKTMLKLMAILFLISAVGSGLATDTYILIIARIIGGLAIGGASVLSPVYISEISPEKYRGCFTITFQLAIVIGILVAFLSDYLLINTGVNNWRWMFIAGAVPSLIFYILLFFVSESPRWLVKEGRTEEAKDVITSLNSDKNPDQLLAEIKQTIDTEVVGHIKYLFRKPYLRLLVIGILVGMFNQLTGINIIMYYSSDIFISAGFSANSALGQSVVIGFTNLLFTILAMMFIDRIGRKKLLFIGAIGMSIFLLVFGFAFLNEIKGFYLLIMLVCFIAFFAFSQGAVIWVLLAEMFPNNIRARGSAAGSTSHWVFNSLLTFLFPIIANSFKNGAGTGYIFIFYAIMTIISFFFFKKYLVETKGKSLEALEKETLIV